MLDLRTPAQHAALIIDLQNDPGRGQKSALVGLRSMRDKYHMIYET